MKKRTKTIISIVIIIAIISALSGTYTWATNNPGSSISIGKPTSETGIYIEHITTGYNTHFNIPVSEKVLQTHTELFNTMKGVRDNFIKTCEAPTHLEIDVFKAEDGGTIVRYHGQITKDGKTSDYDNKWKFDMKYPDNIM